MASKQYDAPPPLTIDTKKKYAATLETSRGAIVVDLFRRWSLHAHPEFIGEDGLHPTVAGYRALADVFLGVLRTEGVLA